MTRILHIKRPAVDHPFAEIVAEVQRKAARGNLCFQKFTCAGCGQRLTIEKPNVFHHTGTCDQCGHLTDIKAQGCNYTLLMKGPATVQQFAEKLKRS
jgi:hypothetical protein